jgi:Putative Ig domain
MRLMKQLLLTAALAVTTLMTACGGGGGTTTTTTTRTCSLTSLGDSNLTRSLDVGEALSIAPLSINAVSGCTLTFSATGLPAGLSIATDTGLVTGAATTTGTYSATITARTASADAVGNSISSRITFTVLKPVKWAVLAASTGLPSGPVSLTSLNGKLYALVSVLSGSNWQPQLWTSTTQGASWVNANLPPPNPTGSLMGYASVTDGTSIYLIGGLNSAGSAIVRSYSNSVHVLTPDAPVPAWTTATTTAFSAGVAFMGATFANNTLYVQGGTISGETISGNLYASSDRGLTWQSVGNATNPRTARQCLVATTDKLLSIGGVTNTATATVASAVAATNVYSSSLSIFNWTYPSSSINFANSQHLNCAYLNGKVYVTGGTAGSGTASNAVYSSADGLSWIRDAASPIFSGRFAHGMTVQNGKLIVVGGLNSAGAPLGDALVGTP